MIGLFEKQKAAKKAVRLAATKRAKTSKLKQAKTKVSEILKGLFSLSLDGWKDDKEKFKLELINDIKTFLFTKWEKPWKAGLVFNEKGIVLSGFRNISGRLYTNSINILSMERNSLRNPYFITVKSLLSKGGKITDKTKVTPVLSYIPMYKDQENKTPRKPDWMLPKLHNAINLDFCEGIKKPKIKEINFQNHELNTYVENFLNQLIKKKRVPKIYNDQADQCFYRHGKFDYSIEDIHMVNFNQFNKIDEYYSTLFHEITHSTQNPARLGRGKMGISAALDYANEELVAEMGAMILCTELGLKYNRQNGITYLKSWLSRAKGDVDKNLLEAYGYACDAAEYLLEGIDLKKLVPESMQKRATDKNEDEKTDIKKRIKERAKQLEEKPKKTKVEKKKNEDSKKLSHLLPRTSANELDYDLAYRAYTGTSFSPEKRAVSDQNSYANILNEFAEDLEKLAKSERQKILAISEFSRFKEGFLKKTTALLVAKSRCLSTMITGGSNFPVRSNQKKLDAEHKRRGEYLDYIEKAQKGIIRKIKGAIPQEEKDKQAFKAIENQAVQYIASIVSISRKESVGNVNHFRALMKSFIQRLSKNHQHDHVNKVLQIVREAQKTHKVVIFTDKNSVWNLENQTDGAKVNETGERVLMENKQAKLVNNLDAQRVQIITEEKPSEEVRSLFKSKAFRWSPRFKAWQRINTVQAISIAKQVFIHCFPENKLEPKPEKKKAEQLTLLGHGKETTSLTNWKPNTSITKLKGALGTFLGGFEKNRFAIVLRGEKGAGKTRLLCQIINLFASQKMKSLFLSLEVSPQSELFGNYAGYISKANKKYVDVSSQNTLAELENYCKQYDVIAVDSWGKLQGVSQEDFGRLVEKYPNVIWLCIFQSTTSGTARGGIMSEYDSSIVIQVEKGGFAECEKNRYNSCDLVYNVFDKKLVKDEN